MTTTIGNSYNNSNVSIISTTTYAIQITTQLQTANSNVVTNDTIVLGGLGNLSGLSLLVLNVQPSNSGDILTLAAGTETFTVTNYGNTYSFSIPQIDSIIGKTGNNTGNLTQLANEVAAAPLQDIQLNSITSQTLTATVSNLSFSPSSAVNGIQVNFDAYSTVPQQTLSLSTALNNGQPAQPVALTTTPQMYSLGGPNNTWGFNDWSPTQLANLAVNFVAKGSTWLGTPNANVYIGNLSVTIYSASAQQSDALDITNFGITTNANTAPAGITIAVAGFATEPTTLSAQLIYNNQALGSPETVTLVNNNSTPAEVTFGGINDLLNSELTANIISDPSFGVRLTAAGTLNSIVNLSSVTVAPILKYLVDDNINFGTSICASQDGIWLFIGSDNLSNIGQVAVYKRTTTQQYNYSNISNVLSSVTGVKQVILNDSGLQTPDNAYSLRVSVTDPLYNLTDQILIPSFEYSISGNVITFLTPISTEAVVEVEQLENYYNYLSSVTDNVASSGFGTSISCNQDGSSLVVGAPATSSAYVFSRLIEKAYITTPLQFFQRQILTGNVVSILVNGIALSKNSYIVVPGAKYINFLTPLASNSLIQVEYDQLIKTQVLNSSSANQFGRSVALQNAQLVIGAPLATNIIGANTILRQGTAKFYVLDTASTNVKTIAVVNLSLAAGITFYINNWPVTTVDSTPQSLVLTINQTTVYSGVRAVYDSTFNTINLYINPTLHTSGITGTNPALLALYSRYVLFQTLTATDQSQSAFGKNIHWLAADLFALQVNTGASYIQSTQINFVDDVNFDSNTVNFYDTDPNLTGSQTLIIYQILTTNRSWVSNYADIIQVVPVKVIQVGGTNDSDLFYDGDITNLWIGNQGAPSESLTLYNNQQSYHGWTLNNSEQVALEPQSITAAWIYDATTSTKLVDLELVDLATGQLPQSIERNLDYVSDLDPAVYGTALWQPGNYNIGDRVIFNNKIYQALVVLTPIDIYFNIDNWQLIASNDSSVTRGGRVWGSAQLGQFWFDTSKVKVVDAQLSDISTRANDWNMWFPNSAITILEWVSSSVPPFQYLSNNINGYVAGTSPYVFDANAGLYYFWVASKSTPSAKYNISANDVENTLANLVNSGIAMISPIDFNRVAVWNVAQYVVGYNAVLHVDYITKTTKADLHSEFLLLNNDGKKSWLNTPIYNKFVDSLCGQTTSGAIVPTIGLLNNQQYGTTDNPVRTIFVDRVTAIKNYFLQVNALLLTVTAATTPIITALSAAEPAPTYGFNESVPDRATLNSLVINSYPENYRILVLSDNTLKNNCWSIVTKFANNWVVAQHQSYNLSAMWTYSDWQSSNVAPAIATVQPTYTINTVGEFGSVSLALGDTLGITVAGNYAIYQNNTGNVSQITDLDLIYLQNGTIQFLPELYDFNNSNIGFDNAPFDQIRYFDDDPATEIRMIITALNQDLLVGELSGIADSAFFTALNYVLLENTNLDWLFKTSFVTVDYTVRNLDQQQYYTATDETTMRDFITESLPYHTRVREFRNAYTGTDIGNSVVADFDIPAIYDQLFVTNNQGQYTGIPPVRSPDGSQVTDAERLTQDVYQNWSNNYTYSISNISIINSGANYTAVPQVTISGGGGSGAAANVWLGVISANIYSASGNTYNGSRYAVNDTLLFNIGASNQPANLVVTSVTANGAIVGTAIVNSGSYTSLPGNISNVSPTSTSGIGNAAQFTFNFGVSNVNVISGGIGYVSQPIITTAATNPNVTLATLKANFDNTVIRKADTRIRFDRIGYGIDVFDPKTSANLSILTGNLAYSGNAYGYAANSVVYANSLGTFYAAVNNWPVGNLANGNTVGWMVASNQQLNQSSALNRIYQYYNSSNTTPANIPALLMTGLTYPQSRVSDFAFVQNYLTDVTGEIFDIDDIKRALTVFNVNFDPAEVNNSLFSTQISKFGSSGVFSQFSNQYFTLNAASSDASQLNLGLVDFTLEFWVRFSSTEIKTTGVDNSIIYQPAEMMMVDMRTPLNTNGLYIYKTATNQVAVSVGLDSTPLLISSTESINIVTNVWQNIVVQRAGSEIKLYLDGNQVAINSTVNFLQPTATGLSFGVDYLNQNVMNGYMDEFRLTANMNRYPFNSSFIPQQTAAFSRSVYIDEYLIEKYTKVLYGFDGYVNEAMPQLTFTGANGQYSINELSWNAKQVNLINYISGQISINGTVLGNSASPTSTVFTANLVNNQNYSNVEYPWTIGGINNSNIEISLIVQLQSSIFATFIAVGDTITFANTGIPLDGYSFVVGQVIGDILVLIAGTETVQTSFGQVGAGNIVVYSNPIISNIAAGDANILTVKSLYANTGNIFDSNINIVASSQTLVANINTGVVANSSITGMYISFNSNYSGNTSAANLTADLGFGIPIINPDITTTDTTYSYGGAGNLLGYNWQATDVENLNINFVATGRAGETVYLDGITANVYYIEPPIVNFSSSNLIIANNVGSGVAWYNLSNANSSTNYTNVSIVNNNTIYQSANAFPQTVSATVNNTTGSNSAAIILTFPSQQLTNSNVTVYIDFSLVTSNTVPATANLSFSYSTNNGTSFVSVLPNWAGTISNSVAQLSVTGLGTNLNSLQVKAMAETTTTSLGSANITSTISNVFVIPGSVASANSQTLSSNIFGLGNTAVFSAGGGNISNISLTGVGINFSAYYIGAATTLTANLNVGTQVSNIALSTRPTIYTLGGVNQLWGYNTWTTNTISNLLANVVAEASGLSTVYLNALSATAYYNYVDNVAGEVTTNNVSGISTTLGNLIAWTTPQNVSSTVNFAISNVSTSSTGNVTANVAGTDSGGTTIGGTAYAPAPASAPYLAYGSLGTFTNYNIVPISADPLLNTTFTNFGSGAVFGGNANVIVSLTGSYSIIVTSSVNTRPPGWAAGTITVNWSIDGGNTWQPGTTVVSIYPTGTGMMYNGNIAIVNATVPVTGITDLSLLQVKFVAAGKATGINGVSGQSYLGPRGQEEYTQITFSGTGQITFSAAVTSCMAQYSQTVTTPNYSNSANLVISPTFTTNYNYVGLGVEFDAYYIGNSANLMYSINNIGNVINLTTTRTHYSIGGNSSLWGMSIPVSRYGLNLQHLNLVASTTSNTVTSVFVDNVSFIGYYLNQQNTSNVIESSNIVSTSTGSGNAWINTNYANILLGYTSATLYNAVGGFGPGANVLVANVVGGPYGIPNNATIDGLIINFDAYASSDGVSTYTPVQLAVSITSGTEVNTVSLANAAVANTYILGSATDLWGYSGWTAQNILNGNIFINFAASTLGNANVFVGNVAANVAYSYPGNSAISTSNNVIATLTGAGKVWANVGAANSISSFATVSFNPGEFSIVNLAPAATILSSSNVYVTGNAYIQTVGDTAFNFGTNDFAIEFWYESTSNANVQTLCEVSLAQSNLQQSFDQTRFMTTFSNNTIQVLGTQMLNPSNIWLNLTSNVLALNVPYFISIERQANIFYLYVDSVLQSDSANVFSNIAPAVYSIPSATAIQYAGNTISQIIDTANAAAVLTFGAAYDGTSAATGIFGDIRVTNGNARHVIDPTSLNVDNISSFFTDANLGIDSLGVTIDGGGFIDSISSYGPEEQIPGRIFDTLNINVYQASNIANVGVLGFGIFKNTLTQGPFTSYTATAANIISSLSVPWPTLSADSAVVTVNGNILTDRNYTCSNYQLTFTAPNAYYPGTVITIVPTGLVDYFSLGANAITTLSTILHSTDTTISLANAAGFINPTGSNVGILLVGGERIVYPYQGVNFTNTIYNVIRGTNGTGIANIYNAGTTVVSIGTGRTLPGDAGGYSWYTPGANTPANGNGLAASTTAIAQFLVSQGTVLP